MNVRRHSTANTTWAGIWARVVQRYLKKTTHKQNKELDKKAQDAGKKSYGPEAIGAETSTGKVVDNFAADISLSDDFDMEQISTIGI